MGKTAGDVVTQVQELIGDYQGTTFTVPQIIEAINWAQDLAMRYKGFKVASQLFDLTGYPTGTLPADMLVVKRVQLVQASPYYTITVSPVSQNATFDGFGLLIDGPLIYNVTIEHFGGHSSPVDVTIYGLDSSWDGFSATMNGQSLGPGDVTVIGVPDSFTVELGGTSAAWPGVGDTNEMVLSGIDGDSLGVESNLFYSVKIL